MYTFFRIHLLLIPLCLLLGATSALAADTWTWENPLPQGHYVNGFWVASATDVFACTDGGTVLHYDGSDWTIMETPVDTPLEDIFGFSTTDIFAVGQDGVILHCDGSSWRSMASPTTDTLNALWGTSSSRLYAVGSGDILLYNGLDWSVMYSPSSSLTSVWGSAWNDVWTVGSKVGSYGLAYHYDGSSWTSQTSSAQFATRMHGVWGSASDNFYATGDSGDAYHYDGANWTMETDEDFIPYDFLWGVWGDGSGNVYICSGSGSVYELSGADWTRSEAGYTTLQAIGGLSGDNVYVGGSGGAMYKKNGATWTALSQGNSLDLNALHGLSASNIYGAGSVDEGTLFKGIVARSTGNGEWTTDHTTAADWTFYKDIFALNASNIWAVGGNDETGDGYVSHYDGNSWSDSSPATASNTNLTDVWAASATDVYAIGDDDGRILHYNGSVWSLASTASGAYLQDIWGFGPGDVYVVGEDATGGLIHHYDGTGWGSWYPEGSGGEPASLEAVWGTGADDVWVGGHLTTEGEPGALWHKDGSGWSLVSDNLSIWVTGIFGASPSDVFFFDDDDYHSEEILHWNGQAMEPLDCPMGPEVQGVWGASTSRYWFANNASIMRLDRGTPNLVPVRALLLNQ